MNNYGVQISSVFYSGRTCQVLFLEDGTDITTNLGTEIIPFTYFPADGTPQGKYFIYFSGTDQTFVIDVFDPNPSPTPSVTPTLTPTPTITETPTQTPTPTITETSTQTPTPTITETSTQTPTPTITETPTETPTPTISETPTQTPTPTITETPTETPTPTISETPTQTPTPSVTPTLTPTPTITETPTQTPTPTITETPTQTPTQTITETSTQTPTPTISETPTQTPTPTITETSTQTPTPTITETSTQTPTPTITETPTNTPTPTITETPTNTPTPTITETSTPTVTPTKTETPTNTPTPSVTPASIVTTNLQLQLLPSSYIGSGTVWDTTIGTTDATLFGSPSYNALSGFTFNATSTFGTIPSVDGVTNFTDSQQYTIEVWFNPDSGQQNINESQVIEKWNSNFSPGRYPYTIRFRESTGLVTVAVYDGSNNPGVGITGFSVNNWVQIVAVFNFGVDETLTVYKNGVSAGSTSLVGVNQVSNTSFVSIAGRVAIGQGSADNKFKGTIGIIRMYNTSLTASQVLQNYDADKSKYGL